MKISSEFESTHENNLKYVLDEIAKTNYDTPFTKEVKATSFLLSRKVTPGMDPSTFDDYPEHVRLFCLFTLLRKNHEECSPKLEQLLKLTKLAEKLCQLITIIISATQSEIRFKSNPTGIFVLFPMKYDGNF